MLNGLIARTVDLEGARVGGMLSLNDAKLARRADDELTGAEVKVFNGDSLEVGQEMDCQGLWCAGVVSLVGAQIGSQLAFRAATLNGAMHAVGLRVGLDMFCDGGFTAKGVVRLTGARVATDLWMQEATLHQDLEAQNLQVGHDMSCDIGFTVRGDVSLDGAQVAGQLKLGGAIVHGGLTAVGLRVGRDMVCDKRFTVIGDVSLFGAQIDGQLSFRTARLNGLWPWEYRSAEICFATDALQTMGAALSAFLLRAM